MNGLNEILGAQLGRAVDTHSLMDIDHDALMALFDMPNMGCGACDGTGVQETFIQGMFITCFCCQGDGYHLWHYFN